MVDRKLFSPPLIARLKRAAQIGIAVVLVLATLYLVNTGDLLRAFREVSLSDIGILIGLSSLLVGASVLKWRLFLNRLGIAAPFTRLLGLYLVGYFVNTFTPSFIGGDVVRSMTIGPSVNRAHAVSATFLERYTGVIAMLFMAIGAAFFSDTITAQIRYIICVLVIAAALGTWMVLSGLINRVAAALKLPSRVLNLLNRVHEGLLWGLSDRRLLLRAFVLSLLFHLLTVVNTAAVGAAVGWSDVSWRGLLVVVPIILLVGALPISPQGLGIQEGAFVFFLHSIGATSGQALAIALILRAKSYLLAIVGGGIWLSMRRAQHGK